MIKHVLWIAFIFNLYVKVAEPRYLIKYENGREMCPYETDFPSNVELREKTIQCEPTPEDHECEWTDEPHFACHNVKVEGAFLTHSSNYTLDTAFYGLCLDMIAAIDESYGASATARVTAGRTGTIRYTRDGEWQSNVTTPDSYHRLACQTSPSYVFKNKEPVEETNVIKH